MIGKPRNQITMAELIINSRKKRSRSDKMLERIHELVDWKKLTKTVEQSYKKSKRGRPSIPVEYMLKCLLLQYMYNLSDPELEDALVDRLSFQRFLGVSPEDPLPDHSTVWRFRERLIRHGLLDAIFEEILQGLDKRGLILRRGTIVDASLVKAARKPPTDKANNKAISPRKQSQQDHDARLTKRGRQYSFGYKGHIGMDAGSGIVRKATITAANVHDSQQLGNLLSNDERAVFGDKGYFDSWLKRSLRQQGIYCGILDRAGRGRQLSRRQRKLNKHKSRVRGAVERVFAQLKLHYGFRRVRYLTIRRNEVQFKFLCMVYNLKLAIHLLAATGG
jgi:IS5 family transposase